MQARAALWLAIAVASLPAGCVFQQHREMNAARDAYRRCLERKPENPDRKCTAERAEVDTRSERYEEDAVRGWSCGPHTETTPGCDPRASSPP